MGGVISGILYEYVYNTERHLQKQQECTDNESSSINSDDELNFDGELDKANSVHLKYQGPNYISSRTNTSTAPGDLQPFCEPIYSGTRSMYCRSPPLTRANLHRSQSVYAKSNGAINRDLARANHLIPAQSLYPLRLSQPQQNAHAQNQNMQNQLHHRSESIYGIRSSFRQQGILPPAITAQEAIHASRKEENSFQPIYGSRSIPAAPDMNKYDVRDDNKCGPNRSDSVYVTNRVQSTHSDDSSYGSYQGSSLTSPNRLHNTQQPNYNLPQQIPTHIHPPFTHTSSGNGNETTNKTGHRSAHYSNKRHHISKNPNGASVLVQQ